MHFFFILLTLSFHTLNGQEAIPTCRFFQKNDTTLRNNDSKISINVSVKDSTNQVFVFLINNTRGPVIINGYEQMVQFAVQAKFRNKWSRKFNKRACLTGFGKMKLPANTYTYNFFNIDNIKGDYNTEIRFLIEANDSVIISKTVSASIDTLLFLSSEEYDLEEVNNYLNEIENKNKKYYPHAFFRKAILLKKLRRSEEATQIYEKLTKEYPLFHRAKYLYGRELLRKLSFMDKEKTNERNLMMEKILFLLSSIPIDFEYYEEVLNWQDSIKEELQTD